MEETVHGPSAQVAFRLPERAQKAAAESGSTDSTGRLVRAFKNTSTVADMLTFLQSRPELSGFNWVLSEVRPSANFKFEDNMNMTVEDLGLSPRGVLVVRDMDC